MKIKIILTDEENGHVRIDTTPPIPNLVNQYRDGKGSPAVIYAVLGIAKMMADSQQIAREQALKEQDIINPNDPRFQIPSDLN